VSTTTSDDTTRLRLALADQIADAKAAAARLEALQEKTRKPHPCHVCGIVTKEDEP
jgi:hypothetical protein